MSSSRKELESSLSKLSLSPQNQKKASSAKKPKAPVADSWEDDDESSSSDTDRPLTAQSSADYPDPPPPTPISPTTPHSRNEDRFISPYGDSWKTTSPNSNANSRSENRPEKTDAVAKRMIAGALGVRAPKKTEDQRAYDRAVKEKEIKRINGEKEAAKRAEAVAARAKAAAWSD